MQTPSATTLPRGLSVEELAGGLTIIRSWRNLFAYALTPIVLMAAGFSVQLFRAASVLTITHPIQLIPGGLAVSSLVLGYMVLVRYVNRTRIEITPERIEVRHGPLPGRRDLSVDATTITRVFVRASPMTYGPMKASFYRVWGERKQGDEICILASDPEQGQAEFIAKEMARVLKVEWGVTG